jgi:CRISPR-associated exonuclease Cas4
MESYIPISFLNDFIFCPRSIYFHQLYGGYNKQLFEQKPQVAGTIAHESIDAQTYSTSKNVLQGIEIYAEQYKLCGKIDLFDTATGKLSERKREIKKIYDGYVFQVYAQYYSLTEMGYEVKSIVIHDLTHNRPYPIPLPDQDPEMKQKFEQLILDINTFNLADENFVALASKCQNCIYNNLCDHSLC